MGSIFTKFAEELKHGLDSDIIDNIVDYKGKRIKTEDSLVCVLQDITIESDMVIQQMKETYSSISCLKVKSHKSGTVLPETSENEKSRLEKVSEIDIDFLDEIQQMKNLPSTLSNLEIDDKNFLRDEEFQQDLDLPSFMSYSKDIFNENNSSENEVSGAKNVSEIFFLQSSKNRHNTSNLTKCQINYTEINPDVISTDSEAGRNVSYKLKLVPEDKNVSKIPKKIKENLLINSSKLVAEKRNISKIPKKTKKNQLINSSSKSSDNLIHIKRLPIALYLKNSLLKDWKKERIVLKKIQTSEKCISANFPAEVIIQFNNKKNPAKISATEVNSSKQISQVKLRNKNKSTNEIYPPRMIPEGLINKNNPAKITAKEVNPAGLKSQIKLGSKKQSANGINPLRMIPQVGLINKNTPVKITAKEVNPAGLKSQTKLGSKKQSANGINPLRIIPEMGLINKNNPAKITAKEVNPAGLKSQIKLGSKKQSANGINPLRMIPQVRLIGHFNNKKNPAKISPKEVNPAGLNSQGLMNKNSPTKIIAKEVNPENSYVRNKNKSANEINPPRIIRKIGVKRSIETEGPKNIKQNSTANSFQGFLTENNSSRTQENSISPIGISPQSANKKRKRRKSRLPEEFMLQYCHFPRRSERIRKMSEQRKNVTHFPTNTEPAKKKVFSKRTNRKPEIITGDQRNLQRNVSENASSSSTIVPPNTGCHERVPESVIGIFTKEGRNYVTLKWKYSDKVDYILEDSLTEDMKVLLRDYVEAIRRRSQLSSQDTSPAVEEGESTEETSNERNDILSPKFIKGNITKFKNKQKSCIETYKLFDNLTAYNLDTKIRI